MGGPITLVQLKEVMIEEVPWEEMSPEERLMKIEEGRRLTRQMDQRIEDENRREYIQSHSEKELLFEVLQELKKKNTK